MSQVFKKNVFFRPSWLLILSIVAFSLTTGVAGQSVTGSISGTIKDSAGGAIPGATVVLVHPSTGVRRDGLTGEEGRFHFGSVPSGEYDLIAEMPGFRRLERKSINLTAAETLSVGDLVLEVGELNQTIEVHAEGASVDTQTGQRTAVLTSRQLEHLTSRGRNIMSMLQLLPGVVDRDDPDRLQHNWDMSINGGRRNTNNVSVDGVSVNAVGNNFNAIAVPSMDAVDEVATLLSNYSAEFGRLSGANIHYVQRSGSRDFHGLLSYFKRHEQFNANDFMSNRLGVPKARYRFHTYTYNVGGPIYIPGKFNRDRDKLFFFWCQEFLPTTSATDVQQRTMPSELERAGDFSQSLDVYGRLISIRDHLTGKPFPNNVIPANRIDQTGQALLKVFPLPNFLDRGISLGNYNYVFQDVVRSPHRTETLKVDYHPGSRDIFTFSLTHHLRRDTSMSQNRGNLNFDWFELTSNNNGYLPTGRYQRVFSPTLVSETTVSYSLRPWDHPVAESVIKSLGRDALGIPFKHSHPETNPLNLLPEALFSGVPNAGRILLEGRFPMAGTHKSFVFANNLSKVWSSHSFKTGIFVDRLWNDNQYNGNNFGQFDFGYELNNPLDTGYAYSNAILGVFRTYSETTARPDPLTVQSNIEWFVQDGWKVTPRLTLDLGLRFCWLPHAFDQLNGVAGFRESAFDSAKQVLLLEPARVGGRRVARHPVTGDTYPASLIGAIAPGTGDHANGMVTATDAGMPASLMEDRGIQWAPRVGFAYDFFGSGRTVLRGGFGMFYNRMPQGQILTPFTSLPPLVSTPTVYYGTISSLQTSSGFMFPSNAFGLDPSGKIPTVMNYTLGLQQNVGFGTVVDVSYVGALGRHLLWGRDINTTPLGANFDPANVDQTTGRPLAPAFLRPYKGYNNLIIREPGSSSNYHSLQVTANRRFARSLEFGAAWTWSKAMDYNSDDNTAVSTLVPVRVWDYGLNDFDRTHVFRANWIWDLPTLPWRSPLLDPVLRNWQVSGVASFQSGAPLAPTWSTTAATDITGSTHASRLVVTGDPILPKGERTFNRYFRTEVFQMPQVGTFGNAARTVFRGPGVNSWDISLFKNFPLRETMRLQFRCELYNAFNHTQFSTIVAAARFNTNTGQQESQSFGQVNSVRNPRTMQFALRLTF